MPNCHSIDPLVTPYVDGQLPAADRDAVDRHARVCAPCHARLAAERAVRDLIHARRDALAAPCASDSLRSRCAGAARTAPQPEDARPAGILPFARAPFSWRARLGPLAVAASLVLIVGIAFLYQLTTSSTRVMAAELAADHVKCFALNGVLPTYEGAAAIESSMLTSFNWRMHVPQEASSAGLELVGSRPCLYGVGRVAHIMYRHHGEPVSLFMLPKTERGEAIVEVLGHEAAIWCDKNRTFVLVARQPKDEVERMARVVRASLR